MKTFKNVVVPFKESKNSYHIFWIWIKVAVIDTVFPLMQKVKEPGSEHKCHANVIKSLCTGSAMCQFTKKE